MARRKPGTNLDSTDLRLITELEINPRQSYVNLAKMLDVNEITVRRRVDRLIREGIISFVCVLNTAAIGFNWALCGLQVSRGHAEVIAREISRYQSTYVLVTSGCYDIIAWISYKDPAMLYDFSANGLRRINQIKGFEAWPVLKIMKNSWGILGNANHEPLPSGTIKSLDELDWDLLAELYKNPRMTHTHLAKKIGVSRQTAGTRLQRLIDEDIIRIQCRVSYGALGYRIHVGTFIKVRPGSIVDVAERLIASPSVLYLVAIAGRYDLAMGTTFRDSEEMSDFLMNELGAIPGIESSDTILHLKAMTSPLLSIQNARAYLQNQEI